MLVRQSLRVSLKHNPSVREEKHAVAHVLDLNHIMRGPQHPTTA